VIQHTAYSFSRSFALQHENCGATRREADRITCDETFVGFRFSNPQPTFAFLVAQIDILRLPVTVHILQAHNYPIIK